MVAKNNSASALGGRAAGIPDTWGRPLVVFLLAPRGFGFGDVKLASALGAALGWYGRATVPRGS
nr:A24 family peptidase [Streptomyces formicae]